MLHRASHSERATKGKTVKDAYIRTNGGPNLRKSMVARYPEVADGTYLNKDNADCVHDPVTLAHLSHHHRDLEKLGNYLLSRHQAGNCGNAG